MTYYSQYGQDKFLEETVFKGFQNGTFVDVGAHDGQTINNTLFFERSRGWTGVNIEPIPDIFHTLTQNRPKCKNICCAVDNTEGTANFILNSGYTEMLSGLEHHYDQRHRMRCQHENNLHNATTNIQKVPTRRLESILSENNISHVHYLSIDVEGAEFAVIQSINFDTVFIDVIQFENNFQDTSVPICTYLEKKGYEKLSYPHTNDIIYLHTKSQFYPSSKKSTGEVDHIYWINLDYRTDRRCQMEDWMTETNCITKATRISAVHTPGRGHVGCLLSHIKALYTFLESSYSNCIIFEDDYVPLEPSTFWSSFQRLAESKLPYDIVMLSYNKLESEPIDGIDWMRKVTFSYTSSGYLITREFAPKLIENFKEAVEMILKEEERTRMKANDYCLDVHWSKLMKETKHWYCFYPRIGKQRDGYSDIQGHFTDYNA